MFLLHSIFAIALALSFYFSLSLCFSLSLYFSISPALSIFLIFSDTVFLSIFMFGCFYFSRFFLSHLLRLNCFIASLFLTLFILLPHSLTMYLSQNTKISIYLYLLLHLTFTPRIAIILLLFLYISLSLTHFQSLWRNLLRYFSLCLWHYSSPSSTPAE